MNAPLQLMLQQAIQNFQNGNFDGTELILNRILQVDSRNLVALHVLGLIKASQSKFEEAAYYLTKAARIDPNDVLIEYNLAKSLADSGNYKDALSHYDKALSLKPNFVEAALNKGAILHELKRYDEAITHFDKALSLKPDFVEAALNKGAILHELKRYDEAITDYDKALSLKPDYHEAWSNKGVTLNELKRYDEAITHFDKALSLKPDYHEAWTNKGVTLNELKRYDEAITHFDKALSLKPDYHEAWTNKGVTLNELKRYDEAITHFDKALSLKPDYAEAWFDKGINLYSIGQRLDARICFEKVLELKSCFHKARWAKLFTTIPVIASGNENLQELRQEFSYELEETGKYLLGEKISDVYEVIGSTQPFYLAYQGFNNKQLLNKYGQLCCLLMNKFQNSHGIQYNEIKENFRIKIGIVGEQISNHSVWNAITKGLVFNLDNSRFEIHIFHLGSEFDKETYSARLKVTSFTNNQSLLINWTKAIIEKNIDVLIYPEIGMNSITTQLASLRLAPLQIAFWGHPETTGLPTIDYYLSAELFEDDFSQDKYTETLVKLPNLGCNYSKLLIRSTKFDFESYRLDTNAPILLCPGTPYKYSPQYDCIFAEIAKRINKGKLIFFNYQNEFTEILKHRLMIAFDEVNLAFDDYIVFIPWLKPEEFYGLMKCADLYLDTIGFSGFNSAMQAIDCALPIVTLEGNFMRGRFASGILKRLGIPELIAKTNGAYVELAVRLVQDKSYRNQIKKKIIESQSILYDDNKPIYAFENFLLEKVKH